MFPVPVKLTCLVYGTKRELKDISFIRYTCYIKCAGDMDKSGSMLADSVTFTMADGMAFNGTRDTAVAVVKNWRGSMTDAKQSYRAIVPPDNTTTKDEWVFQWIDEEHHYKDGKKEHNILHEDYRLVNGKIRQINQYAQAIPK